MRRWLWVAPLCLLIALVAAWACRWDYRATKTIDTAEINVVKWKTDRWTGQTWIEAYGPQIANDVPVMKDLTKENRSRLWAERNRLTCYWYYAAGTTAALFVLAVAIALRKPREPA